MKSFSGSLKSGVSKPVVFGTRGLHPGSPVVFVTSMVSVIFR